MLLFFENLHLDHQIVHFLFIFFYQLFWSKFMKQFILEHDCLIKHNFYFLFYFIAVLKFVIKLNQVNCIILVHFLSTFCAISVVELFLIKQHLQVCRRLLFTFSSSFLWKLRSIAKIFFNIFQSIIFWTRIITTKAWVITSNNTHPLDKEMIENL